MELSRIWAYIDAKKRLRRASENLEEYEKSVYAPGTANMSGMPIEHSNVNHDKFAIIAETHSILTEARDLARIEATREYNLCLAFEHTLTDEEQEIFRKRYILGLKNRDISQELHQTERTVKYINKKIREKFSKFVPDFT